jgi:hypothetical protein
MLPSIYYNRILSRYFSGSGPASLSWDARTYKCAQIYLQKLRPTVANEHSFLQRHNQHEKEPLFFLTAKGNPLPSSQICGRMTKMTKLLDPSITGNVTGKRIRKSAVSRHRQLMDSGESSGLSKDELARQMSHSISTAEGHYAMRDTIKGTIFTPKTKICFRISISSYLHFFIHICTQAFSQKRTVKC